MAIMPAVSPRIPVNPNKVVGEIPTEIQDIILKGVDFPFCLTEAKALRLELIKEQESLVIDHGRRLASRCYIKLLLAPLRFIWVLRLRYVNLKLHNMSCTFSHQVLSFHPPTSE